MKTFTTIEEDTEILPYVVADCVAQEAARFLDSPVPLDYAESLAARAAACYAANDNFRKKLRSRKGNAGRDHLYAFMRSWLAASLKREQPELHRLLPSDFNVGGDSINQRQPIARN